MRELKFRGLRVKPREWVHGYLVERGKTIHGGKEMHEDDIVVPAGYSSSIQYSIIGGTGGQYTGLKDNNGKEIYEGDIVRHVEGINNTIEGVFEIKYMEADGAYRAVRQQGNTMQVIGLINSDVGIRVVGNIHEDPDLLKEEK